MLSTVLSPALERIPIWPTSSDEFLELGGVGETNKALGTGDVKSVSHHG